MGLAIYFCLCVDKTIAKLPSNSESKHFSFFNPELYAILLTEHSTTTTYSNKCDVESELSVWFIFFGNVFLSWGWLGYYCLITCLHCLLNIKMLFVDPFTSCKHSCRIGTFSCNPKKKRNNRNIIDCNSALIY